MSDNSGTKGVIDAIWNTAHLEHGLLTVNAVAGLCAVFAYLLREARLLHHTWPWVVLSAVAFLMICIAGIRELRNFLKDQKSIYGKYFATAYILSMTFVASPLAMEQFKDLPDVEVLSKDTCLVVHDNGSADVVTKRAVRMRQAADKIRFWGMEADSSDIQSEKVHWTVRDMNDANWRPTGEIRCEHDSRKKLTSVIFPNPLQANREYEITCSTVFEGSYPIGIKDDYLRAILDYPTKKLKVTVQFDESRKIVDNYDNAPGPCISQVLSQGQISKGTCLQPENVTPSLLQFEAEDCLAGDIYFLEWIYQ